MTLYQVIHNITLPTFAVIHTKMNDPTKAMQVKHIMYSPKNIEKSKTQISFRNPD